MNHRIDRRVTGRDPDVALSPEILALLASCGGQVRESDRDAIDAVPRHATTAWPGAERQADDVRILQSSRLPSTPATADDFPNAVGHALGYLLAVAAVPPLAAGFPWQESAPIYALLLVAVVVLRTYLGNAIRDALSAVRARAILNRVDQAAISVFIGSGCVMLALDAFHHGNGWAVALYALLAMAALCCSIWLLVRARYTVFSTSFLSILE